MPTMMSRKPCDTAAVGEHVDERRGEQAADERAGAIAAYVSLPSTSITISAPVYDPASKPMMSGVPSGLRVSDWKIAPPSASAMPHPSGEQQPRQPPLHDERP